MQIRYKWTMQGHSKHFMKGVMGTQLGVFFPFQPRLWTFMTPTRMQLPNWECIWESTHESLGSIPCTLLHLWECVSHLNTFFWPHKPLNSTCSHKPNVKVATFPFMVFSMTSHRGYTQKWFFSKLPSQKYYWHGASCHFEGP
jgi:hypothetical protein